MLTYKPRLDPTLTGEAKIMVEIKLDRPFSQRVAIEDESGSVSLVDVLYSWLPSKCARCGHLGHKASRCLGQPLEPAGSTKTSSQESGNIVTSVISAGEPENMLVDKEERDTTFVHSVLNVTVPHTPTAIMDVTFASVITLEDVTIKLKDQITIDGGKKPSSKKDTSFSLKGNVGQGSPNTASEHLSTPALADDEDESLSDEELDPKENLSPLDKVFLRDRPVKPSTKVKEMQSHSVARGRGNRGRGKSGGHG
ncbi:uncharacterized protein LOC108825169 [Raphanus sativus]|uniref:Uncharacterized protein LOC108825169 n=1 Tax=Raphanus sativus TaxID=3726 RepID=A0A6J0L302_RAPSA|nr:uncharacterized protein LOC108825169 [Raphanus sativus]